MNSLRKWFYRPRRDDPSLLAQFYFADEGLNLVAAELDSFDGRKDPERCSALVNQLRQCQDRVLNICIEMMEELLPGERAARDFRVKFPDDVMQDNLSGQLWFGAECLAAENNILNREAESQQMRPLAKAVTKAIENVRNLLREQCLKPVPENIENIRESLRIFDHFFAEFELSYVSAMVHVKSVEEHNMLENVIVMFSETLQRALRIGLVSQEQVDNYDPVLMFTIPRLAIVCGLIIYSDGPLCLEKDSCHLPELFRPFKTLLYKIRELLWTMTVQELSTLEKCLCSMEEPDMNLQNLSKESLPPNAYGTLTHTSDFMQTYYSKYPSTHLKSAEMSALCSSSKKSERYERKRERYSGKGSKTRARQERQSERFLSRLIGVEDRPHPRRRSRVNAHSRYQRLDQFSEPWNRSHYTSLNSSTGNHPANFSSNRYYENQTHLQPALRESYRDRRRHEGRYFVSPDRENMNPVPVNWRPHHHAPIEGICNTECVDNCANNFESPTFHVQLQQQTDGMADRENSSYIPRCNSCSKYECMQRSDTDMGPAKVTANIQECVSNVVSADPSLLSPFTFYDQYSSIPPNMEFENLSRDLYYMNVDSNYPRHFVCSECVAHGSCDKRNEIPPGVSPSDSHRSISNRCGSSNSTPTSETPVPSIRSIRTSFRPYGSESQKRNEGSQYSHTSDEPFNQNNDNSESHKSDPSSNKNSQTDIGGGSSGSTSPHHSGTEDDEEVALALQAAELANTWKVRSRFSNPKDLIHRLFVCIAGVADQLQTNHASDLRKILKSVFLVNQTPETPEEEKEESFYEEVGKEDVSTENDSELCNVDSAEDALVTIESSESSHNSHSEIELNPSLADCSSIVEDNIENPGEENSNSVLDDENLLTNTITESTVSSPDISTSPNQLSDTSNNNDPLISSNFAINLNECDHLNDGTTSQIEPDMSTEADASEGAIAAADVYPSTSSHQSQDSNVLKTYVQDPPLWVRDEDAPRCMACQNSFNVVRRRHHCRNCGKVFCGHCSRHCVPLPHFGIWKNVRVCNACFLYYVTSTADGSSALS